VARAAVVLFLLAGLLGDAAWGQGVLRTKTVLEHLQDGDCRRANERLTIELQRPSGPMLLLAGWLSQWGRCLERNADKAYIFYERAHQAGEASAALRLSGLAATPEGGSDVVAVLWWARKAGKVEGMDLGDCDPFPGRTDVAEAEFVDALSAWPQPKLMRCRATTGFLSLMRTELFYPQEALRLRVDGSVQLDYDLEAGRVDVTPLSGKSTEALVRRVEALAAEAMSALPRTTVPARGSIEFAFRLE
jgi:hypothetical protein